jgi:hypothetical protein
MTLVATRVFLSQFFRFTSSRSKEADKNDCDANQDPGDPAPQWAKHHKHVDLGQDQNGANMSAVQASGDGINKGAPDGVSASPSRSEGANIQGRSAGGESGGGAYPNPKSGKAATNCGFMGHGGQTDIGYHGGEQAGDNGGTTPNATTRGKDDYPASDRS